MTPTPAPVDARPFVVDTHRSSRVQVGDGQLAVWVAVCARRREDLDAAAKQAAISWAALRHKVTGAIDQVQGPMEDDGKARPVGPSTGDPGNSGVVTADAYRQLVAQVNMAKTAGVGERYVMFVRVLGYGL